MRIVRFLALLVVAAGSSAAQGSGGTQTGQVTIDAPPTETREIDGVTVRIVRGEERRLEHEIEIPLPRESVWWALTTEAGIRACAAPGARVELRVGGAYEYHYLPDAPPGQRGMEGTHIASFIPLEMLAGTGSAPPQFPAVREEKTRWVYRLDAVDSSRTRLRLLLYEFGEGEEWDAAFDYFIEADATWLRELRDALVEAGEAGAIPSGEVATAIDPPVWRYDRELTVTAPIEEVWTAFTTSEGLASWAAPAAHVQLRTGGPFEVYFRPEAPAGERGMEGTVVLGYVPGAMLSYSGAVPPHFPELADNPPWIVWRFARLPDGGVALRFTGLWQGSGDVFDRAVEDVEWKMEMVIELLRRRFGAAAPTPFKPPIETTAPAEPEP
ncbi:MAG: SRPBCC family protein [Planctomycetota bacterium]|jgi:uncharacterized protein YndB with AHSA1/START domain